MKKKFLALALIVGLAFGVSACGMNVKSDVLSNMSDIRYVLFVGTAKGVSANLMCGMRENPYAYDGVSHKQTEFGVVEVTFEKRPDKNPHFAMTAGGASFAGELEENPYNHTFMTDVEKVIGVEEGVYITIEGVVENMQLIPVSAEWEVQYDQAVEIGLKAVEEEIKGLYESRRFRGECYLKIVMDKGAEGPFYWCFIYQGKNGASGSVVIDVHSGEILTQKTVSA